MNNFDRSFVKTDRVYAYSPTFGRKRADVQTAADVTKAIEWADKLGAVNLVLEEGPASKPTGTTVLWERNPKVVETVRVTDADGNAWDVPRSVLVGLEIHS